MSSDNDTHLVNPDRAAPHRKSHIWVEEDADDGSLFLSRCKALSREVSREDLTEIPVHFIRNNEAFCQTCRRLAIPDDELNDPPEDGFDVSGPDHPVEADGDGGWGFARDLDLDDTNVVTSDTHVTRMRFTVDLELELPTDDRSSAYVMSLDQLGRIGHLDHVSEWSWQFAGHPTVDVVDSEMNSDGDVDAEASAD